MMKKLPFLRLAVLFLLINSCISVQAMEEDVSLERKIGNSIIVGFQGARPDTQEFQQILEELGKDTLSGIILYGHNI